MVKRLISAVLVFGTVACVDGNGSNSVPESETTVILPLTSRAELDAYLNHEPTDSPLKQLSPAARQRFLDSLVFGERGGLGSFMFVDLQAELNDVDGRSLLKLFDSEESWDLISPPAGIVAPMPPEDLYHYYCAGRATCAYNSAYVCKSNC
jgi:hypothetical protein